MKHYTAESASTLPPNKLRDAIDQVSQLSAVICQEFINCGRGHERPSETIKLSDPLALRWKENAERSFILNNERRERMAYHGSLKVVKTRVSLLKSISN
jgi:hypothetical protein